jgi:hypothetical protein
VSDKVRNGIAAESPFSKGLFERYYGISTGAPWDFIGSSGVNVRSRRCKYCEKLYG